MGNRLEAGGWERILDAIQDMVMVLDVRRRIVWANRSLLDFFGLPEEEIIGLPCHRLFHGTEDHPGGCPCAGMGEKGTRESFELDLPGRGLRVRITVDPLPGGDGTPAGAVHIVTDVTAARRAENHALFQSRRLELLARIATTLLGDFAIGAVLAETARDLARFLGVPRCTIFLYGTPGETGEHREPGFSSALVPVLFLAESGECRTAFESGRPVAVADFGAGSPPEGTGGAEPVRIGSYLGVPLRDRENLVGALFLDRPVPHDWTENEIVTAEAVARQVAVAVRQARGIREQKDLSGRLLSLMNNVPGAVYQGLRDWSLSFMGAEVERLSGYAAEDILRGAVRWQEIVHPEDLPVLKSAFRSAVAERRKVLRIQYRIVHRDGGIRWLEDRRQLIYGPDGSFAYVDGLLLDVTEAKRAEEELREANHVLETLVEASPLPIMALDREGRVTLWNPAAERTFGWTRQEVIGKMNPVVPEESLGEFHALRRSVLEEGGFSGMELLRRKKGNAPIHITLSTAPMRDALGNITGIMSIMGDITERRRIEEALRMSEEQLRQAQKMEAVGRLAGGIAHDFNNLLTAIRGYSDLVLQRLDPDAPYRKDVEEIRKAGERASSLTHQLLAFSRKQVLHPTVLDLNEVVGSMEEMVRRIIGENIDLVTVLRPDLWKVRVDRGQIEQVIMNLVVNARDAIARGGGITVETGNVVLDADYVSRHSVVSQGAYAMLSVSDTGCGMGEETKARLFEPFFTTKEKGKGTGLGLSTVYGIVKQSNGYIWVYSEPHRGSVFKIYLPRHEAGAVETGTEEAPAAAPRGHETILLVEDEEMVRVLVRDVLRKQGYSVLEAGDGAEAMGVAVSHRGPIHLMITDVVMPVMGGREVAISLAPLQRGMKVLYMSGYTDDAIVRHGGLSPGTHFLQKPFRIDAFLRKVRGILDG